MQGYTAVAEDSVLIRLENMSLRRFVVALTALVGVTIPARIIDAQTPLARLWPSSDESSALSMFGSVMHCTPTRCDHAAALGVDARVTSGFHVSADARKSGFDFGESYAWRHVGVAAIVGRGTSLSGTPRMVRVVEYSVDTAERITSDTVMRPDSTARAARWSSAEMRLTWREDRWWATALAGRFAVAQQGAALWGGVQLGADVGRGASVLLGLGTTSRLLAVAATAPERRNVSLGLGFNTSILSSRPTGASPQGSAESHTAFSVSGAGAGRSRITIRVPSAHSVEFASDCTGWKPLDMTRTRDGWVVEVETTRGLHRANIRVDGGKWIAPPGLSSTADEFAGEVGIFVIE
jgi:hypothetical protein